MVSIWLIYYRVLSPHSNFELCLLTVHLSGFSNLVFSFSSSFLFVFLPPFSNRPRKNGKVGKPKPKKQRVARFFDAKNLEPFARHLPQTHFFF